MNVSKLERVKSCVAVILSEAKLQRSGLSPRGAGFQSLTFWSSKQQGKFKDVPLCSS
jgi:hypothetical protein